jgi:uncharacterized membrane protein YfcA
MQLFLKALFAFSFFTAGALMFYVFTVKSLKDGKARTRYGEANRQTEPFSFWFTVVAGVVLGLFACGGAIFVLIHPLPLK